ncbi:hypothetical protein GGI23_004806 [Coemansia sp. RSA 2559]|nr:hypothetical protein GGI23_004806 [Coemansia sp. RSA 2559]KAJ2859356.1 hypothetical protein GGI22_003013 [Coemansia erecta]
MTLEKKHDDAEPLGFSWPTKSDFKRLWTMPKEEKQRRWRLFKTYIPDWIIVIVINIAGGLFGMLGPRHRQFSLEDRSIQYASHYNYVPDFVPPLVAYAAPIACALVFLVFRRDNWHDFHCTFLGIFMAMGLNNVATNVLKNAVGRPRPDFISRCQPSITQNPPLQLVDSGVCTQTDLKFLHDGMRSFPSGHASLAFCGLTFTALYLASHFRYNDMRGHAYKSIVFYVPLFCAALIAISRTADYHHHWQDVLAGSAMGAYIGWFGYRTYFPPVFDPRILSDRPYPSRIPKLGTRRDDHILPVDQDPYQNGTPACSTSGSESQRQCYYCGCSGACGQNKSVHKPEDQMPVDTPTPPGNISRTRSSSAGRIHTSIQIAEN